MVSVVRWGFLDMIYEGFSMADVSELKCGVDKKQYVRQYKSMTP